MNCSIWPSCRLAPRPFARGLVIAALAVATLGLAACTDADEAETAPIAVVDATLMLNWTPNAQHAGIYLAHANGWYEEAGIRLTIVEPAVTGADQVVGSGAAQFGISQAESILPARAAGVPVVSIAAILPHNDSSFMALASSGITRPADFAGRTYGGYGGLLETELLAQLMSCDGADPATLNHVEVGNIDYLSAMDQGHFDFVWVFEGWDVLRAREVEGVAVNSVAFVDWLDCIPDWYTPTFITSEALIAQDPDLVRAFLAATFRGYRAAMADPQAAADALLAAAPELDEALVRLSTEYHATRFEDEDAWGTQQHAVWQDFAAFLLDAGLLEQEVDAGAAFTNAFLPAGG